MSFLSGQNVDRDTVIKIGGGRVRICDSNEVSAVQTSNPVTEITKRMNGGKNKKNRDTKHIDESEEPKKLETIDQKLGRSIQEARCVKGMTQAELAKAVNIKAHEIAEIERGKALKDNHILSRLEQVLQVKLTGKQDIGKPLNQQKRRKA